MRKRVMICVAACLYYSGCVKLARWWTQRQKSYFIVLNYHTASSGNLRQHMLYLRRHYHVMHLENALATAASSSPGSDRRTPLVLTFDDGYHDNYTHAFALARELQVPITIFLIPGYIESGNRFWWLSKNHLVKHTQVEKVSVEGKIYHLHQPVERQALLQVIDTHLRHAPSVAQRETFLLAMHEALAVPVAITPEEDATRPLMWAEIREMQQSGEVSFGAHTMHHPILSYLTDQQEVQREIQECRVALEQQLERPVRAFAYPVGQRAHIGERVTQAVQQAGYDWAFTTLYGFNTRQSNRYLLRRIEADVNQHWLVLAVEAAGLWSFFSRLRWLPGIRAYINKNPQK
ncbi:MAG TPA: polysaccharide deacetylase family protein [Ktedonobacteraceae bacterium]|nr:polysaccharide deacetylase family protein [Ktedonobacteraceae bacterium]